MEQATKPIFFRTLTLLGKEFFGIAVIANLPLEQQWNDPEVNRHKLEFLGWLLNRANHKTGVPDMTSSPDQAP